MQHISKPLKELIMELQVQEITTILPTKSNIDTMANTIAYEVSEGNIDPVEAIVKVTAMEQVCKAARLKIEGYVLANLELYPQGKRDFNGAKIERAEVGTSYDFSHDAVWAEMYNEIEIRKSHIKEREEQLKKIPAGKLLVDEETGETIVGAAKSSKTSFKVTLSK